MSNKFSVTDDSTSADNAFFLRMAKSIDEDRKKRLLIPGKKTYFKLNEDKTEVVEVKTASEIEEIDNAIKSAIENEPDYTVPSEEKVKNKKGQKRSA